MYTNNTKATWTDERVDSLKKLWGEGLSASLIAAELGGVSRNAVIGKVHRLGLSGRSRNQSSRSQRKRVHKTGVNTRRIQVRRRSSMELLAAAATPPPIPEFEPAAPVVEVVVLSAKSCTMLELTREKCRWPISEPGASDFCFCGNTPAVGLPYCVGHARIAYKTLPRRRAA
jgi:GcrA cell cycle regulator